MERNTPRWEATAAALAQSGPRLEAAHEGVTLPGYDAQACTTWTRFQQSSVLTKNAVVEAQKETITFSVV